MAGEGQLGDGALAIFAFAAYHQLESGQPVKSVIREDGQGHKANEAGLSELEARGLASVEGNDITFSDKGLAILQKAVDGLKSAATAG